MILPDLAWPLQFESGAILLYLAERCGQLGTPAARARATAWVLMANTGLTNSLFVDKFREKGLPDVMGSLERVLEAQVGGQPMWGMTLIFSAKPSSTILCDVTLDRAVCVT